MRSFVSYSLAVKLIKIYVHFSCKYICHSRQYSVSCKFFNERLFTKTIENPKALWKCIEMLFHNISCAIQELNIIIIIISSFSACSEIDGYGFKRPGDFDYETYEEFMKQYLSVLARRAKKWEPMIKGEQKVKKSRKG